MKLLIVKQILLVNNQGNVWRAVWRICILILGCLELTLNFQHLLLEQSFNSKKRINFCANEFHQVKQRSSQAAIQAIAEKKPAKKIRLKQDLNPYLPDNSWGPITYWATKLHIRSGVHLRWFFPSNGGIWSQSCPSLRHLFYNSLNCTWPTKAIAFLDFNQMVKCNNSFKVVSKFYI